ncbi:MAG: cyclase family protein [Lentimicrobium sp.]
MIYDLTHRLEEEMPVWPGSPKPKIVIESTIEQDGYLENHLQISSHSGTHVDAPAHLLVNGCTLDKFRPDYFIGKALKIDLTHCHQLIKEEEFLFLENFAEPFDFLLLHTGWSRYWGHPVYFQKFPVLNAKAAKFLSNLKLKAIGIDTISFDPIESDALPNHHIFMLKNMLLIENITAMDPLPQNKIFELLVLPLYFRQADGAPARIVARVEG